MERHRIEGGCHCGNISFVFETSADLENLGLRACQCSFCRAHNARTTSDPDGEIRLSIRDRSKLSHYRFGLGVTDFVICARCGVFVGAVMQENDQQWMTVNANAFKPPPPADFPLAPIDYENEETSDRVARRRVKWTPVSMEP